MTNSSFKPLQTLGKWYQPRNPKTNPKPAKKNLKTISHPFEIHFVEQTLVQMTGTQDSEAHFLARASQYGLPTPFVDRLKAEGVATMGQQLAFAIFRPGAEFEERAFDDWATNINNGTPLALGAAAALRRLHFESEEVMTSTIRASVETSDPSAPKPIPFAEKTARMDEMRACFQGLHIHGAFETGRKRAFNQRDKECAR